MKKTFIFLLFILCVSCKKNNQEDPVPSEEGSNYRIDYVEYFNVEGGAYTVKSHYKYDVSNRISAVVSLNSSGDTLAVARYEFNAQGLLSRFSNTGEPVCYVYHYNNDSLVEHIEYYRDAAGTNINRHAYYRYTVDGELANMTNVYSNGSVDSTAFGNFVNGRPTTSSRYSREELGYDYYLTSKAKYTYDNRMNRIQTEITKYDDTTQFFTSIVQTYVPFQNRELWLKCTGGINVRLGGTPDDINSYSKNSDMDYEASYTSYSECGLSSDYSNTIQTQNNVGLPVTYRGVSNSYSCGILYSGPRNSFYKITYRRF